MNGLYDQDFVGYRKQTRDPLVEALRSAVVAVDTNVLLDLYRYRPQTAHDLIAALEGVGGRLVVPHQVLAEFWRKHSQSQVTPGGAMKPLRDAVQKTSRSLGDAIDQWAKSLGLETSESEQMKDGVISSLNELIASADALVGEASDASASGGDPYLERLEELLHGRVTDKPAKEQYGEWIIEGRRRVAAEEPPGYLDADKEDSDRPEGAAGDYLVWIQAATYAASQRKDLLIVTRDGKADWWWRRGGSFMGPRPELSLEYHQLSEGQRLFMLQPAQLLELAPEALQVEVDEQSSSDAGRVAAAEEERTFDAWTLEGIQALLDRLDVEAPVQADALRRALPEVGGKVMREEIYELGEYDDDRTLRNFTRPYTRITGILQSEGIVPANVRPVFVARYPDGVRTSYFSVPPEVPDLLAVIIREFGGLRVASVDEQGA